MHTQQYLITVNASPSLEEPLVDWLLSLEAEHGFSSFPVNSHDSRHQGLSLAEQVSGRKRQIRFQMYVQAEDLAGLLESLKRDFSGSGLQYWVLPVVESGHL